MTTRQLTPYRGFLPLSSLRSEVDRLLESFARQMDLEPLFMAGMPLYSPTLDLVENSKGRTVTAELPGLEQKDVEVDLTADSLVLKGEKTQEKEEKGDSFYRKERKFGSFRREILSPGRSTPPRSRPTRRSRTGSSRSGFRSRKASSPSPRGFPSPPPESRATVQPGPGAAQAGQAGVRWLLSRCRDPHLPVASRSPSPSRRRALLRHRAARGRLP